MSSSRTVPPSGGEVVAQDAGSRCPVEAGLGGDGDSSVTRFEEEVCVELPASGLSWGEARYPGRGLVGQGIEHR